MNCPCLPIEQFVVNAEYEALVPRVTADEYITIVNSVKAHGIREPLVITQNNIVIDGHTRLRIAKELGLKEIPFRIESYNDNLDEQEAVIAHNLERRQLNLMQLGILGNKIEQIEKEKAKLRNITRTKEILEIPIKTESTEARQIFAYPHNNEETVLELSKIKGKSVEIAAKKVGISSETQRKVDKIIAKAKESPAVKKEMDEALRGTKSVNKVYNTVKQLEKKEAKVEALQTRVMPTGKYEVIYADPPWSLNDKGSRAAPDCDAHFDYPTMELDEICKLKEKLPITEDAVLFLWVPSALLQEGLTVMKVWGFEYKANAVWDKGQIGIGHYFRLQHEHLFIGIKGKIGTSTDKSISSVLKYPRGKHSKKPEEIYSLIERMYPLRKYLELFARNTHENWAVWGNEV